MMTDSNPVDPLDKSSDPGICGCKGVRYCALCRDTDRVKALQRPNADSLDYDTLAPYVYCHRCTMAHALPDRREYSMEELMGVDGEYCDVEDSIRIDGLLYAPDFLSPEEECSVVEKIDTYPWALSQSGRRKQDFSPQVNFKRQRVKMDRFQGVPAYAEGLISKMAGFSELQDYRILELCNLEYDASRASQIEFHRDDMWIWGERLISINLIAGAVMSLRGPLPKKCFEALNPTSLVYIPMAHRSLLAMFSDVRHLWEHGIMKHHVPERRIALTMREPEAKFMPGGELFEKYGREMLQRSKEFILT